MEELPTVLAFLLQHLPAILLAGLFVSLLSCYALQTVVDKLEQPYSWMAWVPLLQTYPLVKAGDQSFPHFVGLMLAVIPIGLVAALTGPLGAVVMLGYLAWILVFFVRLLWNTAEARGVSGWMGILVMIPFVGPLFYLYIAFHDGPVAPSKAGLVLGFIFYLLPTIPQLEEARRIRELGAQIGGVASASGVGKGGEVDGMVRGLREMLSGMQQPDLFKPDGDADPEGTPRERPELAAVPPSFECPDGTREMGAGPPKGRERWCERDGRKHGGYAAWHRDGPVSVTGTYSDGERIGVWTRWFASGGKQAQAEFVDGREHGLVLTWDALGRPVQTARFLEGRPDGG
mgnify:CR=1 FL=1